MDKHKVRERRRKKREEQRRWRNDGGYVASLVAARLAGMLEHRINEYRALDPRDRFNKRNLFDEWIKLVDTRQVEPDFMPHDWLTWEALARRKNVGATATGMQLMNAAYNAALKKKFDTIAYYKHPLTPSTRTI
jgi:FMN-dependent NADH-azoreductase